MESEQKQKKVLLVSLTVLVLAGMALGAVGLVERRGRSHAVPTAPVITSESVTAPVIIREQPAMPTPVKAEPVVVATDWKIYRNAQHGFEFRYPKEWPAPIFTIPTIGTNTAFLNYESVGTLWKLGVGQETNACEGEPCHPFSFEGYDAGGFDSHRDFQQALVEDLKRDEIAWVESEKKLNGADAIVFASGGMCGYRNAYIFNSKTSISFLGRCAEDDPELAAMFDAILSTFKLTKE